MSELIVEELVSFQCGELLLSGVLAYPEQRAPKNAVLICAPHPNFAGNMENNLVAALAREFSPHAMTLRFDYRGIGASEIRLAENQSIFDYWDDLEQSKNYAEPLADVAAAAAALNTFSHGLPLAILGYSFGSIVGLMTGMKLNGVRALAGIAPPLSMYPFDFLSVCRVPCMLVSGADDFVFSADESKRLRPVWSSFIGQSVLSGHDHFFRGFEDQLCARIRKFIEEKLNA
ncbi:MAG TPA: hypothetical protein VKX17_03895 [Planctomycetota bacterium]|nr:hypothetical protein [Planctomycetota bacterium]